MEMKQPTGHTNPDRTRNEWKWKSGRGGEEMGTKMWGKEKVMGHSRSITNIRPYLNHMNPMRGGLGLGRVVVGNRKILPRESVSACRYSKLLGDDHRLEEVLRQLGRTWRCA